MYFESVRDKSQLLETERDRRWWVACPGIQEAVDGVLRLFGGDQGRRSALAIRDINNFEYIATKRRHTD